MPDTGRKLRVLLVDDEGAFRRSLAGRLEIRHYEVLQAESGHEALRMVRFDSDIDVVVLDKNMPEMDGPETLNELKVYRPEIPVIMLTGYGSVDSALDVGRLGVFRYFAKPVPINELTQAIKAAAQKKCHARARLDMPKRPHKLWRKRLTGSHNLRPIMIFLGFVIILMAAVLPLPQGLLTLLDSPKTGHRDSDLIAGHPAYSGMAEDTTIAQHFQEIYRPPGMTPANPMNSPPNRFTGQPSHGFCNRQVPRW